MKYLKRSSILVGVSAVLAVTVPANAQTAQSCVAPAYERFLSEIDKIKKPFVQKGIDYLNAYGWIEATRACFAHTTYPASKQQEATDFKGSIERLSKNIGAAIRTNTAPTIYGKAIGAGGTIVFAPKAPPSGARSGMVAVTGMVALATTSGTTATTSGSAAFMLTLEQRAKLQRFLLNNGHYSGEIDGVLGAASYAAIKRYQRAKGWRQTGVLSSAQLREILLGG